MATKITIECEGDPDTIRDAVTIIEQMLPYMTDNVVVFSEVITDASKDRAFKLASVDPQVLVNNVLDQAVDAYKQCYIDGKHTSGSGMAGICQGFSDALAAMLSSDERPADDIIEDLASAGLGEEVR